MKQHITNMGIFTECGRRLLFKNAQFNGMSKFKRKPIKERCKVCQSMVRK